MQACAALEKRDRLLSPMARIQAHMDYCGHTPFLPLMETPSGHPVDQLGDRLVGRLRLALPTYSGSCCFFR